MRFSIPLIAALSLVLVGYQSPRAVVRSQLEWFDRNGNELGTLGELADYGNVELSPDGTRVAVTLTDPAEGTHDIWFYDVATGQRTRFTSDPADENWLIWSPDGKRVVFNRFSKERLDLYLAPSNGGGSEELLLTGDKGVWPVSWSPDSRFILVVKNTRDTGNDLWLLPLFGDRMPSPIFQSKFNENWAAFSPDGRWIAFSSTESGAAEVYVTPFPVSGRKWRISSKGGTQARWRRDGKELFYMAADRTLMSAAVAVQGSDFEVNSVRPLFVTRFPYPPYHAFDAGTDGQRFLVNTLIFGPGRPPNIAD